MMLYLRAKIFVFFCHFETPQYQTRGCTLLGKFCRKSARLRTNFNAKLYFVFPSVTTIRTRKNIITNRSESLVGRFLFLLFFSSELSDYRYCYSRRVVNPRRGYRCTYTIPVYLNQQCPRVCIRDGFCE